MKSAKPEELAKSLRDHLKSWVVPENFSDQTIFKCEVVCCQNEDGLKIEVKNPRQILKPSPTKSRLKPTDKEVNDTDWEKILSIPWNTKQQGLLENLQKSNNRMTFSESLAILRSNSVISSFDRINNYFIRFNLPYRLKEIPNKSPHVLPYEKRVVRIYVCE